MVRSQKGTDGSTRRGSATSTSSASEDKERRNGVLECATLSSSSSSSVGSRESRSSRGSRESRGTTGSRQSRGSRDSRDSRGSRSSTRGGGRYTSRHRPPPSKEQGEDQSTAKKKTDTEAATSSSSSTSNKPKKRKWRSWRLKSRPTGSDGGDGQSSSSSSGGGENGDPSRQGIEMRTTWSLDSGDASDSASLNSITTYQRRSERKRKQQEERDGHSNDGKTSNRDAKKETEYIKNLLGTPKFVDTPTCNDSYNVCGMFGAFSDKSIPKKNPQKDVVRSDGEAVVVSLNRRRSSSLLKNQPNPSSVTTPSVIRCCNIGVDGESLCFINRNFCVGAGEGGIAKKRRVHFNEHVEEVEPGIIKNWENSADYQEKKAAADKKKKDKSEGRKRRHRSSCMPKIRFRRKHRKRENGKSTAPNQPSSSNASPKTDQDGKQKDPIAQPELSISGSVSNDTQSIQSLSESTSTGNNVVSSSRRTPSFVHRARHNDSLKWKDYEVPETENDSKVCQIVINVGRDEVHASM